MVQDLPPRQGFRPIDYRRHLPQRGPPGWVWFLGVMTVVGTGFTLSAKGRRINQELDRERLQAQFAIEPLVEAEEDREYLRKKYESQLKEARIMKDVIGWNLNENVYNHSSVDEHRLNLG